MTKKLDRILTQVTNMENKEKEKLLEKAKQAKNEITIFWKERKKDLIRDIWKPQIGIRNVTISW